MNKITNEKTMTVKEVAEVFGVTEEAIKKHIRELFPDTIRNGITTYLNEYQITMIKSKMVPTTRVVGNKTNLEKALLIKQAMLLQDEIISELTKENESLKNKITEDKPKVEFFDTVTGSRDTIDMASVAKILNIKGIGRNTLFEILREKRILRENNIPYQKYVDAGYFRLIESSYTKPDGSTHINIKPVVFQKGLNYIKKVIQGA